MKVLLISDTRDAEKQNEPYFTMVDLRRVEKWLCEKKVISLSVAKSALYTCAP
jgi:hypothetical protein